MSPLTAGGPPAAAGKDGGPRGEGSVCEAGGQAQCGRTRSACSGVHPSLAQEVTRGPESLCTPPETGRPSSSGPPGSQLNIVYLFTFRGKKGGKGKFLAMLLILVLTVLAESVM